MAYDKGDLEAKALEALKKYKLTTNEQIISFLPCSEKTFYNLDLHELQSIRNGLSLNSVNKEQSKRKKKATEKLSKEYNEIGYVYLINCENTDFYKIGLSKIPPYHRMSSLQTGCPFELTFVHISYTVAYKALEVQLHNQYVKNRHRGEWFEFTKEELSKVIKSMQHEKHQLKIF